MGNARPPQLFPDTALGSCVDCEATPSAVERSELAGSRSRGSGSECADDNDC